MTIGDFATTRVGETFTLAYLIEVYIPQLQRLPPGETYSTPHRFVWPSELDLMARLAGMTLRERWSDWTGAPFTSDSTTHVSVWERSA